MIRTRGGIRVGKLLGFPIYIDPTLIILVLFLVLYELQAGPAAFVRGLVYFGVLVFSVVWHELGHAIAVKKLELGESIIVLHGLGGVTRYKSTPSARQGIIVALAGPAAGLLLGGLVWILSLGVGDLVGNDVRWALGLLVIVNLVLNLANLLPMFPLDGGQVMRFVLQLKMPQHRALRITAVVGGVVLALTAIGTYLAGFGGFFLWIILALIAAENWRLWRHTSAR